MLKKIFESSFTFGTLKIFFQKTKLNKNTTDWTATDWTSLGGSFKIASWNVAGNFTAQFSRLTFPVPVEIDQNLEL